MAPRFGKLKQEVLKIFEAHPEGVSMPEIREALGLKAGEQEHLNRRVRELRSHFDIDEQGGRYILKGAKAVSTDDAPISEKLRAQVFHRAHHRCQSCGARAEEDGVKLQADHRIPRTWGGKTELDNLWALCGPCNRGKRDHFASYNPNEMKKIVSLESVHERIAKILQMRAGNPVPSDVLEFVANVNDFQEDWQRRLRELRTLGIEYDYKKTKLPSGKVQTSYILTKWKDLPPDPTGTVRRLERERAKKD